MANTNKEWVTVFSSINMIHANIVKGCLEAHEIPVRMVDEHTGSLQITLSVVTGGIKVQVPKESEQEASEVLAHLEMHEMSGSGERKWAWFMIALFVGSVVVGIAALLLSKCLA